MLVSQGVVDESGSLIGLAGCAVDLRIAPALQGESGLLSEMRVPAMKRPPAPAVGRPDAAWVSMQLPMICFFTENDPQYTVRVSLGSLEELLGYPAQPFIEAKHYKPSSTVYPADQDVADGYIEGAAQGVGEVTVARLRLVDSLGDPVPVLIFARGAQPEGAPNGGAEPIKPVEKEIECKAGTYLCVSYDDGKTWMHKKYLGLIVKAQSMELFEFNENPKNDAGDKPEKPADDEGSGKPVEMDDFWERYVSSFKEGRSWTWKMAAGMTIEFEVTSVTETQAIVRAQTKMNGAAMGEPNDTEHDLVQRDADDESGEEAKWVEKEIEVEAGKFVCVSVGGDMWLMKKYPAIVVKGAGIELKEFNE